MPPSNAPQGTRYGYLAAALAIPAASFALAAAILQSQDALSPTLGKWLAVLGALLALVAVVIEKMANRSGAVILSTVVVSLVAAGALVVAGTLHSTDTQKLADDSSASNIVGFSGGCKKPYAIWGQNRWQPLGAKVLERPMRAGRQVGSVAPNKTVYTDGWVRTELSNLTNSPPWNKDVWFHLADGSGWVGFAGVRGAPTHVDPTGGYSPDGGQEAAMPRACHGALS